MTITFGYLLENGSASQVSGSAESLKRHAASSPTVLKALVQLYQLYRGEDKQLSSKDARALMITVMRSIAGGAPQSTELGMVTWEPDNFVFVSFFDQVGDQPLGQFLGITDVTAIPEVGLEMKADSLRDQALKDAEKQKQRVGGSQKLLNSKLNRFASGMPLHELYLKQ